MFPINSTLLGSGDLFLWDMARKAGFLTMHKDGECGGLHDRFDWDSYSPGDITGYYGSPKNRTPAEYQFPAATLCPEYAHGSFQRTANGRYYEHAFRFLREFLSIEKYLRKFATIMELSTHFPGDIILDLDEDLAILLQQLSEQPQTAVVLTSDHGMHFGSLSSTPLGFVRHRHPFLSVVLPSALLSTSMKGALEVNQYRITSHLDTYRTLLELMFLPDSPPKVCALVLCPALIHVSRLL